MRDLIPTIHTWLAAGKKIALATVVQVEGSSPRPIGAKLIVSSQGEFFGSVSGGCVESSVVEASLQCLQSGKSSLLHFGIDNSSPWSVGLACGGKIDVYVEPLFNSSIPSSLTLSLFNILINLLQKNQPLILATGTSGNFQGRKGIFAENRWVEEDPSGIWSKLFPSKEMAKLLKKGTSRIFDIDLESSQPSKVFLDPILPQARLVIVGAVHIAATLVVFAHELGFKTIVIDPRSAFLTRDRFPFADEFFHFWPQEIFPKLNLVLSDCVVILSHDEKIDVPALFESLKSPAGYIGVLGSKKTRNDRFSALKAKGISEKDLLRIHAPIGLNIGALKPEEIALSIITEIIAELRKKSL